MGGGGGGGESSFSASVEVINLMVMGCGMAATRVKKVEGGIESVRAL